MSEEKEHSCCCGGGEARSESVSAASAAQGDGNYICPMCPTIQQDDPGDCPICGMALEPTKVVVGTDPHAEKEIRDLSRRFWIGLFLTLPVFLIAMGKMIPGLAFSNRIPSDMSKWIELVFAIPVVLWVGGIFFKKGWSSIQNRHLNMFTLIMVGVGAAFAYSVAAVLVPGVFPESFRKGGEIGLYFEAACVITVLVILGQWLEARARMRTGAAIQGLMALSAKDAHRLVDGQEEDVCISEVRIGDLLRVRPGERVPIDGVMIEGASRVDESMITGEPVPVKRGTGDEVIGGTVNEAGAFTMRVERIAEETLLSQIVAMVAEAQRSRAPIQKVADTVAGYFVPAVLIISVVTFIAWAIWGPDPAMAYAVVNAVAVLIIACPCALGLATPMAIMVGMGRAAQSGILVKNAEILERIEKVDVLVTDKTGTLTAGRPSVVDTQTAVGVSSNDLIAIAAALEIRSEHPLARAIVSEAKTSDLAVPASEEFESVTGKGVSGIVEGKRVRVGNSEFIRSAGIVLPGNLEECETSWQGEAKSVVWIAADENVLGLISIADPIKETTRRALEDLHKRGVKVIMATGDHEATATAVGKELGLDEVHAGLTPEDKIELVRELRSQGFVVAMAGDGINDAPALAEADVGLAMGTGTDVAIESAGITLVKGDLRGIASAIALGKQVMRNIRQNLFFAFGYNSLGVPLAAGVLYPIVGWLLSPMVAGAAMSFSSVSVIANSLRLRKMKL